MPRNADGHFFPAAEISFFPLQLSQSPSQQTCSLSRGLLASVSVSESHLLQVSLFPAPLIAIVTILNLRMVANVRYFIVTHLDWDTDPSPART